MLTESTQHATRETFQYLFCANAGPSSEKIDVQFFVGLVNSVFSESFSARLHTRPYRQSSIPYIPLQCFNADKSHAKRCALGMGGPPVLQVAGPSFRKIDVQCFDKTLNSTHFQNSFCPFSEATLLSFKPPTFTRLVFDCVDRRELTVLLFAQLFMKNECNLHCITESLQSMVVHS